jgi:putative PIN family toxin of toxin-antitoxin system
VADVNVFISAALVTQGPSGRLINAALEGRWQLVVSPHLLAEVRTVFGYERISRRRPVAGTRRFVADLAAIAELVPDAPEPWPAVTRDLEDDYLVALAKSTGVDAIISGDAHLKELVDLVPPVMRPADFLAMVTAGR